MNYLFNRIIPLIVFIFSFYNLPVKSEVISQEKKEVSPASQECASELEVLRVPQAFEKVGTVNYITLPRFLEPFDKPHWTYRYSIPITGSIKNINLYIERSSEGNQISHTIVLERLTNALSELPKYLLNQIVEIFVMVTDKVKNGKKVRADTFAPQGMNKLYPESGIYNEI